jgi:hypothetical protein
VLGIGHTNASWNYPVAGIRILPLRQVEDVQRFVQGKNLAGTEAAEGVGFLYGHDLFFFCLEVFLYQRNMFVGNILDLFFGVFGFVLAEAVFL